MSMMRCYGLAPILAWALLTPGAVSAQRATPITDLTPDFWRFYEAAASNPAGAPTAWRDLYYGPNSAILAQVNCPPLAGGTLPETQWRASQRLAPHMREASAVIARALPEGLDLFGRTFPEFRWGGRVYVMWSAFCFDGRAQIINGEPSILLGVDVLASTGNRNATALVLHELFHVHHGATFAPDRRRLWHSLWREGLATYAARTLAPKASLKEQLLPPELIAAVDKDRARLAADLLTRLDDEGGRAQTLYFRTDDRTEPVPPRAGYYLGLLVAEQLAASGNDLATMTKWDAETAGSRVRHALSALADASSSDSK